MQCRYLQYTNNLGCNGRPTNMVIHKMYTSTATPTGGGTIGAILNGVRLWPFFPSWALVIISSFFLNTGLMDNFLLNGSGNRWPFVGSFSCTTHSTRFIMVGSISLWLVDDSTTLWIHQLTISSTTNWELVWQL